MFFLVVLLSISNILATTFAQQTDEGPVSQSDLQDFIHRLTQQHMLSTQQDQQRMPTTQQQQRMLTTQQQQRMLTTQQQQRMLTTQQQQQQQRMYMQPDSIHMTHNIGPGGAYASSYASVKRPSGSGRGASSQAEAYASVRDVDDEERLSDYYSDYSRGATLDDEETTHERPSTPPESASTKSGSPEGPYTLKRQQQDSQLVTRKEDDSFSDVYFVAIVAGCCAVGIFGVISAGFCFYKLQKSRKAAADVEYPAYGVTGPSKGDLTSPNGDRKLAQSAQMYHYQHQKQQMIAVEKAGSTKNTSASDVDSEEENEEGDYTVYECPGLAPAGEMEVKNPLFQDDSTPVSPPQKIDSVQSN